MLEEDDGEFVGTVTTSSNRFVWVDLASAGGSQPELIDVHPSVAERLALMEQNARRRAGRLESERRLMERAENKSIKMSSKFEINSLAMKYSNYGKKVARQLAIIESLTRISIRLNPICSRFIRFINDFDNRLSKVRVNLWDHINKVFVHKCLQRCVIHDHNKHMMSAMFRREYIDGVECFRIIDGMHFIKELERPGQSLYMIQLRGLAGLYLPYQVIFQNSWDAPRFVDIVR